MQQHAVICDFSFLFHLSRCAAEKAPPQYDLIETTIENVVGKLRTIKSNLAKLNIVGYDLVFVEDREPLRKIALLPGYKANRSNSSEDKNKVKHHLLSNGHISRFCWSEGNEADDAIASVLRLANAEKELSCTVVTGDRDIWQLIQDRVRVYNPIKHLMVTDADIEKAFRCKPIHIPLFKALWGDSGDCVPNVMPRMQKQLLPILNLTDGTLDTFSTIVKERKFFLTEKCYGMYSNAKSDISRNYELVKLDAECALQWE